MKKIGWVFVLISVFIILHSCVGNEIKNNQSYYIECGQAVFDRDRKFFIYSEKDVKKQTFKYASSINIIEKYLTMQVLLFVMSLYIKPGNACKLKDYTLHA